MCSNQTNLDLDDIVTERYLVIGDSYSEYGGYLEGTEQALWGESGHAQGRDPVTGLLWVRLTKDD